MSTHDFASGSAPIEMELFTVSLLKSGAFRTQLRFDDSSHLHLDFEPESDGHRRMVDVLARCATRALSSLGSSGVVIVGMTAPDEDEDGDS
jgi:hypothetical protein